MNVVIGGEMITKKNIFFYDEVDNKVVPDSLFVQTGFSNGLFSMSGIYINTFFTVMRSDKYFKKYKYILDPKINTTQIETLIKIEELILNSIDRPNLSKIYRLKDQLASLSILVFDCVDVLNNNHKSYDINLMLKISGVWITENDCGITFKFFHINN